MCAKRIETRKFFSVPFKRSITHWLSSPGRGEVTAVLARGGGWGEGRGDPCPVRGGATLSWLGGGLLLSWQEPHPRNDLGPEARDTLPERTCDQRPGVSPTSRREPGTRGQACKNITSHRTSYAGGNDVKILKRTCKDDQTLLIW